ncbi:DUF1656 domain-containing protein [Novosphingobium sp. KCTC 2891]|uniref:DUF1656 domain-containing protein n=1 Tax=Novosphingobium sp. KCTC 2891 TaxID=2989730 RepID=UPI002223D482|nr:DUF1656 domain-containing protein [Novosphingobium sp. KCTC 2891]MCW1383786.1 DUF1656 domain-containing protein [Novosphingobium sp. KCTC 2891]
MIEELHLFGIYMPAALVWASIAGLLAYWLRNLLQHIPHYELLWHPGVLELALFALLWWGLTLLADNFLPRAWVS